MQIKVLLVFSAGIVFNAMANILIKSSSFQDKESLQSADSKIQGLILTLFNPLFISGLASFGIALIAYRYVLGQGLKLSLAYPVFTSTGFIIVLIASSFLFKEKLSSSQWLGIVFIIAGVWLTGSKMFTEV
ncbi:MAG: SMR family transporter [Leptospiraceae bacterium]|nr:cation transporter [Leptospiraceae bacterium]MCK6382411.1 SMR family transporter [Leptospiraceae bacterium]NUM41116.1 cation transporter [Leptospiraceae bacterium]